MATEPPLILAFDTAAAHCAAALVRATRCSRGATSRWTAARPSGCCRCSRRCWPRRARTGPRSTASRSAPAPATSPACGSRWRRRAALRMALDIPAVGVTTFEALADRPGPVARHPRGPARQPLRPGLPRRRAARPAGRGRPGGPRPAAGGHAVPRLRRRDDRRGPRPRRRARGDPRRSRGAGPHRGAAPRTARRGPRRSTCARRTRCRPPSPCPRSSMTPEALAALHALAFTDTPRPWTAAEFDALLRPADHPARGAARRLRARADRRAGGRAPDPRGASRERAGAASGRRSCASSRRRPRRAGAERVPARGRRDQRRRPGRSTSGSATRPPAGAPATTCASGAPPVDALVLRKRLARRKTI